MIQSARETVLLGALVGAEPKPGRYQHVTPLRWLSGWAVPLVSNGSRVPFVEAHRSSDPWWVGR